MKNEFPPSRFNESSAKQAFAEIAAHRDFDIIRWALLVRYAEIRKLFSFTDPVVINRAAGKMEELEWMLEQFGVHLYGGLPVVEGTPADGDAGTNGLDIEIGGGYPGSSGS